MSAGPWSFTIECGSTWRRVLTWRDAAAALVNLTGYTGRMQIRRAPGSAILADLNTTNGKMTLGGALGTITVLLTATETAALAPGFAVYDLELQDAAGFVTRLVEGAVTIAAEITV